MEQEGLTPRDLIPFMGSRAKVSEVLSGKRSLTMQMARALHANLGIPADVLLQQPGGELPSALDGIEWARFPLAEMAKRGWIPNRRDLPTHAEKLMRGLIDRAGGEHVLPVAFYRKNDLARPECEDGPVRAQGVVLGGSGSRERAASAGQIQIRHGGSGLPARGREAELVGGGPEAGSGVSGETRHSYSLPRSPAAHAFGRRGASACGWHAGHRPDPANFWFCLLHELAHIGRHLGEMRSEAFVDDLTLRDVKGVRRDARENEADEWAENGLIPEDVWRTSRVKDGPSPLAVVALAQRLGIHPAIVAGRIRHETQNFRLLSHFVGTGVVRRQLFEREGLRRLQTSASCSILRALSVSEAVTKGGGVVMAKHFPKGLDNRMRDRDGEIRKSVATRSSALCAKSMGIISRRVTGAIQARDGAETRRCGNSRSVAKEALRAARDS